MRGTKANISTRCKNVLSVFAVRFEPVVLFFVQVLAYSVACVSVSSFCGGLVDASKAEETMNALRALTEESQQVGV